MVDEWQGPPLEVLPEMASVQEAYALFSRGQAAVAVEGEQGLAGVVAKSDLLEFWARLGQNSPSDLAGR